MILRRRLIKRNAFVILVVLLCAACPSAFADPSVHDGLSPPAAAWGVAMETADLAALTRMYDGATASFPPDKRQTKGVAAIMADYAALFAAYKVTVETDDTHWVEEGPLVVSWGLTTLTLRPKAGGRDVVSRTRFTDAAIRIAGGWRYLVDHASVPIAK